MIELRLVINFPSIKRDSCLLIQYSRFGRFESDDRRLHSQAERDTICHRNVKHPPEIETYLTQRGNELNGAKLFTRLVKCPGSNLGRNFYFGESWRKLTTVRITSFPGSSPSPGVEKERTLGMRLLSGWLKPIRDFRVTGAMLFQFHTNIFFWFQFKHLQHCTQLSRSIPNEHTVPRTLPFAQDVDVCGEAQW